MSRPSSSGLPALRPGHRRRWTAVALAVATALLSLTVVDAALAQTPSAQIPPAQAKTVEGLIIRFRTAKDGGVTATSATATAPVDGVVNGSAQPAGARQPKALDWWWPYRPDRRPTRPGNGGNDQGGNDQGGDDQGGANQGGADQGGSDQGNTDQGNTDQGSTDQDGSNGDSTEPADPGPIVTPPEVQVPTSVDVDPATGQVADPINVVQAMGSRAGVAVAFERHAADGTLIARLPSALTSDEARNVAQRLMKDPAVLSVTPDILLHSSAIDPLLDRQWSIQPLANTEGGPGSMNAMPLWPHTLGATAGGTPVVVAVLDSGRTDHPDLNAAWLGGHDFVSASPSGSMSVPNDGDGRDADPSDPGNACADGPGEAMASNWHGTAVAGVIAATMNNGIGLAGGAPAARIVPVRVLGRCGGRLSDTLDAMQWAAGLSVPGVPDNPNPARIINLSLASDESEACSSETSHLVQDVIDRILARNVLIVAAAGNDGALATYPAIGSVGLPANCRGVLSVAAHTRSGDLATYSSYGARVSLTAPGGGGGGGGINPGCKHQSWETCQPDGIVTTMNSGTDAPGEATYTTSFLGTSAATPHVSAAAALLLALRPEATPQDLISALTSTARPWPETSFCAAEAGKGLCGSGMVDAAAAAAHLLVAPQVAVEPVTGPFPGGTTVTLNATGRSDRYDSSTLTWQWQQVSGPAAVIQTGPGSRATVTLPLGRSQVVVEVKVTDPVGLATFSQVVLDVNNAPLPPPVAMARYPVGALVQLSLAGNDPDGDTIRYALIRGPADLTVDSRSGLLTWVASSPGRHTIVVALTDAYGARGEDLVFTIDVESPTPTMSGSSAAPASGGGSGGGGGSNGLFGAALFLVLAVVARSRRLRGREHREH